MTSYLGCLYSKTDIAQYIVFLSTKSEASDGCLAEVAACAGYFMHLFLHFKLAWEINPN